MAVNVHNLFHFILWHTKLYYKILHTFDNFFYKKMCFYALLFLGCSEFQPVHSICSNTYYDKHQSGSSCINYSCNIYYQVSVLELHSRPINLYMLACFSFPSFNARQFSKTLLRILIQESLVTWLAG